MVNHSVGSELEPAGSNVPNVTEGKGSGCYQDPTIECFGAVEQEPSR